MAMSKEKKQPLTKEEANEFLQQQIKRSKHLLQLVEDQLFAPILASVPTGKPHAGFIIAPPPSTDGPSPTPLSSSPVNDLQRSNVFKRIQSAMTRAHAFARGSTQGQGGDELQRFIATHAPWSATLPPNARCSSSSIGAFQTLFDKSFALDFSFILLPIWTKTNDGYAVLMFSWREESLMSISSSPPTYCLAIMAKLDASKTNEALGPVRTALDTSTTTTATSPQCPLLPRAWLLPPKNSERAIASATANMVDDLDLSFEEVRAFGQTALFHYISYAIIIPAALTPAAE